MSRMTNLSTGNDVQLFTGGFNCLNELLRVLDSATHHIHIETLAFYDDKSGRMIADVLMNKAQLDGVEVRVLTNFPATDGSRHEHPDNPLTDTPCTNPGWSLPFYEELRTAGVQVINSHPLSLHGFDIDALRNESVEDLMTALGLAGAVIVKLKQYLMQRYLREESYEPSVVPAEFLTQQAKLDERHEITLPGHIDHRKLVIVDGASAIVATYNLGRDYLYEADLGPSLWEGFWYDAAVTVTGPAVNDLQKVFAERWMLSAGDVFASSFAPTPGSSYTPSQPTAGVARVTVLGAGYEDENDNPIRAEIHRKLTDNFVSRSPITLINPYICDDFLIDLLIRSAGLGAAVTIVCADHHLDSGWSRDASQGRYKRMVDAGITLCEYPGRMLHAKILSVGNDWSTIGSYNWNYRSAKRDLECNIVVEGTQFTTQVAQFSQGLLATARAVTRPATLPTELKKYPIGCLDAANYSTLPAEVKAMLEKIDWDTRKLEWLEVI